MPHRCHENRSPKDENRNGEPYTGICLRMSPYYAESYGWDLPAAIPGRIEKVSLAVQASRDCGEER